MRTEPETRAHLKALLKSKEHAFKHLLLGGAALAAGRASALPDIRAALIRLELDMADIECELTRPYRCTLPREYASRHVMEWHASHLSQAGAYRRSCRRAAARRFRDIEMARDQLELARQGRLAAPYRRLP